MKKLFLSILVICSLLGGNAYADEDMLLIQCQSDDPKLSKFKPLYEIYPKTANARAGPIKYVINYFAEDGILISSVNDPIMVSFIFFYRNTGKYKHTKNFPAKKEGGVEKQIQEFGTCVKKEKVF
jgi:hypothetical protein